MKEFFPPNCSPNRCVILPDGHNMYIKIRLHSILIYCHRIQYWNYRKIFSKQTFNTCPLYIPRVYRVLQKSLTLQVASSLKVTD